LFYKQTKKKNLHKANNSFPFSLLLGKRKLRRLCRGRGAMERVLRKLKRTLGGVGEKREVGR
jgi:hypothetical protein